MLLCSVNVKTTHNNKKSPFELCGQQTTKNFKSHVKVFFHSNIHSILKTFYFALAEFNNPVRNAVSQILDDRPDNLNRDFFLPAQDKQSSHFSDAISCF